MSIEIDNLMYTFEDEELDEIDYLEIMSLDDIIKDNPSFIALSRNDIQDNLYNMFLNKKKAENVVKLFYEIIDDNNKKRGLLNNYDNYIFNVEAEKKENDLQYNKDPEDANYFNKLEKREISDYNKAKNKYFFCLKYNNESTNIRFNNDKKMAWFDELLNTQMKICRGSGVLILINGNWKIKHYVLSMTIPNDTTDEVIKIKAPIEDALISTLKENK